MFPAQDVCTFGPASKKERTPDICPSLFSLLTKTAVYRERAFRAGDQKRRWVTAEYIVGGGRGGEKMRRIKKERFEENAFLVRDAGGLCAPRTCRSYACVCGEHSASRPKRNAPPFVVAARHFVFRGSRVAESWPNKTLYRVCCPAGDAYVMTARPPCLTGENLCTLHAGRRLLT